MSANNKLRLVGVLSKVKAGHGAKVAWAFATIKPDGDRSSLDFKAFKEPAEVLAELGTGSHVRIEGHLERQKPKEEGGKWEQTVVADEVIVNERVEKEQTAGGVGADGLD